jgi:MoxR-like ATPase
MSHHERQCPVHAPPSEADIARVQYTAQRLFEAIRTAVIGQDFVVQNLVAALLSRGHCLMVGVPGLAKTLLVKTLARALSWEFRRIQFTPDLMPGDVVGTEVLETDPATGTRTLRFVPGPIFANIVLADEVNRTPPKTQSALLEAMQEGAVTVGGRTVPLEPPFCVVATQNPIEQEGTYPLPEAQLDRFMFSLRLDYPTRAEEERIVLQTTGDAEPAPQPVASREELLQMQHIVRAAPVSPHVAAYAVALARATRPGDAEAVPLVRRYVEWGAGPRASQYLVLGAKARAVLMGRPTPSAGDVRAVAQQVLSHRVIVNYAGVADGVTVDAIIEQALKDIREPSYGPTGPPNAAR